MNTKSFFERKTPIVPKRGIHLDLKGNPPTPARLLSLLDLFARARINVVLAEYEDTFPWRRYPELKSPTAYSADTIRRFMARASKLGIEVIPLVQCLGHAENVLAKNRFRRLREIKDNVAEFCPSRPKSAQVVIDMVNDVLALSGPSIKHFHLGGDEAWHMGSCPRCRRFIARHGKGELYLKHVGPVLDYLKGLGIQPILWHDMMREWPLSSLRKLGRRADLMAWSYGAQPVSRHMSKEHMRNFRRAGIALWGGSAYKGAEGAFADLPDINTRNQNNLAFTRLCREFSMKGVVATAWSRYNTFMAPCETIDASLDALVLTASIFWDGSLPGDFTKQAHAFLGKCGELKRFKRCRAAAYALVQWQRHMDWRLEELERAACFNGEPDRINPAIIGGHRRGIKIALARGRKIGAGFVRAHRGLIPDRWLKLYAASRFIPYARRCRNLPHRP